MCIQQWTHLSPSVSPCSPPGGEDEGDGEGLCSQNPQQVGDAQETSGQYQSHSQTIPSTGLIPRPLQHYSHSQTASVVLILTLKPVLNVEVYCSPHSKRTTALNDILYHVFCNIWQELCHPIKLQEFWTPSDWFMCLTLKLRKTAVYTENSLRTISTCSNSYTVLTCSYTFSSWEYKCTHLCK